MKRRLAVALCLLTLAGIHITACATPPGFVIKDWSPISSATGERYVEISVECVNGTDLLDNKSFRAVLEDGTVKPGISGSFDMIRTHAGDLRRGVVYFGRYKSPIRRIRYGDEVRSEPQKPMYVPLGTSTGNKEDEHE